MGDRAVFPTAPGSIAILCGSRSKTFRERRHFNLPTLSKTFNWICTSYILYTCTGHTGKRYLCVYCINSDLIKVVHVCQPRDVSYVICMFKYLFIPGICYCYCKLYYLFLFFIHAAQHRQAQQYVLDYSIYSSPLSTLWPHDFGLFAIVPHSI